MASFGAYLRPTRFTSSGSNPNIAGSNSYYNDDSNSGTDSPLMGGFLGGPVNGVHSNKEMGTKNSRFGLGAGLGAGVGVGGGAGSAWRKRWKYLRWCLIPMALFVVILVFWSSSEALRTPPPPPPEPVQEEVDPLEQCPGIVKEYNIPPEENITLSMFTGYSTATGTALDSIATGTTGKTGMKGYKHHGVTNDESKWAKKISATQLMEIFEREGRLPPRILHQSWKSSVLPDHFSKWSREWRRLLDDTWLYVLWTDADNRKLVQKYYPKYLKAYDALPREIYRADMVRNMYMHHFGGVYADLDLVPLAPLHAHLPILLRDTPPPIPIAYMGHMGDDNYAHSIPNAFFVSTTPGHPFWLMPLEYVKVHMDEEAYNAQPEGLTGPVALRDCYREWEKDKELREGGGMSGYDAEGTFAEVRVLSNEKIYPFSWYDSPMIDHCLCRPHSPTFSEKQCQWRHLPGAWTITYWTHSWGF